MAQIVSSVSSKILHFKAEVCKHWFGHPFLQIKCLLEYIHSHLFTLVCFASHYQGRDK